MRKTITFSKTNFVLKFTGVSSKFSIIPNMQICNGVIYENKTNTFYRIKTNGSLPRDSTKMSPTKSSPAVSPTSPTKLSAASPPLSPFSPSLLSPLSMCDSVFSSDSLPEKTTHASPNGNSPPTNPLSSSAVVAGTTTTKTDFHYDYASSGRYIKRLLYSSSYYHRARN